MDDAHEMLLTDSVDRKLTMLETLSQRWSALVTLGLELASARESRTLFAVACRGACELTAARYAMMRIVDEKEPTLIREHVSGLGEAIARDVVMRSGDLLAHLREHRCVRVVNPAPESLGLPSSHPPIGAFLGVPISSATRVHGWLYLVDKIGGDEFDEDAERLATMIAAQTAITYENLQRYEQIQRHASELELEVAERTHAERQLADALRKAEDSDRLKSAFLANISHEIRTPLNAIVGYAGLIADAAATNGDEPLLPLLAGVRRGTERLIRTVGAVIDMSRMQTDSLELFPTPVALRPLLETLVDRCRDAAAEKGLDLTLESDDCSVAVLFDEHCLTAALAHLLDNAIKFTAKGRVDVRLRRDDGGSLCVAVHDTGIGMDAEFLSRAFAPFSQADPTLTRRYEGTGLGLALVKRYAELNGADVTIETAKGTGSVFTVRFPPTLERAGDGRPVTAQHSVVAGRISGGVRTALLVEDDTETQCCMRMILDNEYKVLFAASGQEVREQLAAHADIDVVLMDISLKGSDEDGLAITRFLRGEGAWKQVPIIVTSAHAFPEDRANAFAAGCDAYLTKPFGHTALLAEMRRAIAGTPAEIARP